MSRIAAQLYTLRDYTGGAEALRKTLLKVAAIGYDSVQLSAVGCMDGAHPEVSPVRAREMLDEAGLSAPLTHRPWDEIFERTEECIDFHKAIGAELVGLGSLPGQFRSSGLDGYRRFLDAVSPVAAKLTAADLRFAYHNHAFEFERHGERTGFDVFIEEGGPDLLFIIDTYWVVHAGVDLLDLIGRLGARVPMIHVKDKVPYGNEVRMAPVGEGNLNWRAILPAFIESGTELFAVEQDDCYGRDAFECMESSFQFLSKRLRPELR